MQLLKTEKTEYVETLAKVFCIYGRSFTEIDCHQIDKLFWRVRKNVKIGSVCRTKMNESLMEYFFPVNHISHIARLSTASFSCINIFPNVTVNKTVARQNSHFTNLEKTAIWKKQFQNIMQYFLSFESRVCQEFVLQLETCNNSTMLCWPSSLDRANINGRWTYFLGQHNLLHKNPLKSSRCFSINLM